MRLLFVDTTYHLAVFSPADGLHKRALRLSDRLAGDSSVRFVTSEVVLIEFLAHVRKLGPRVRADAARFVRDLRSKPGVEVVRHTAELFDASLNLYQARPDKAYSLADCISMELCRRRGISEVLMHDRDFEREGFVALLRDPSLG